MTATNVHELGPKPDSDSESFPEAQEFAAAPSEPEAQGAEIIQFPQKAVGEVAVSSFAQTDSEWVGRTDPDRLAKFGVAVREGSGSTKYLTRDKKALSVAPNSAGYSARVRELPNR